MPDPPTLTTQEVAARIKAARLLRGLSQAELAQRLADDGLPSSLVGRLERGDVRIQSFHRRALALALRLPERWFLDPVDALCAAEVPPAIDERLARIERILTECKREETGE